MGKVAICCTRYSSPYCTQYVFTTTGSGVLRSPISRSTSTAPTYRHMFGDFVGRVLFAPKPGFLLQEVSLHTHAFIRSIIQLYVVLRLQFLTACAIIHRSCMSQVRKYSLSSTSNPYVLDSQYSAQNTLPFVFTL